MFDKTLQKSDFFRFEELKQQMKITPPYGKKELRLNLQEMEIWINLPKQTQQLRHL